MLIGMLGSCYTVTPNHYSFKHPMMPSLISFLLVPPAPHVAAMCRPGACGRYTLHHSAERATRKGLRHWPAKNCALPWHLIDLWAGCLNTSGHYVGLIRITLCNIISYMRIFFFRLATASFCISFMISSGRKRALNPHEKTSDC